MKKNVLIMSIIVLTFSSCKDPVEPAELKVVTKEIENSEPYISYIQAVTRVSDAKKQLKGMPAGDIVWKAIRAHGGLLKWYANGPVSFRFKYQPLDGSMDRDTYQIVDTYSSKAVHTSVEDCISKFGTNNDTSWVMARDSTIFKFDTKFWALTPFYFIGQPFVLDGEGVKLQLLAPLSYNNELQDVIKVTFEAGTGDAPDDYYILYFNKETHLLSVIRYIVSYPKYFKEGSSSPEKFMEVVYGSQVRGILFPNGYKTYLSTKDGEPGDYITKIDITDIEFKSNLEKSYFDTPAGAKLLE